MVDIKEYLEEYPAGRRPDVMDATDIKPTVADGTCIFCRDSKRDKPADGQDTKLALFENFNDVPAVTEEGLGAYLKEDLELMYFLLPIEVNVFVFKTRTWGRLRQYLAIRTVG
jgi:hypothetical protein